MVKKCIWKESLYWYFQIQFFSGWDVWSDTFYFTPKTISVTKTHLNAFKTNFMFFMAYSSIMLIHPMKSPGKASELYKQNFNGYFWASIKTENTKWVHQPKTTFLVDCWSLYFFCFSWSFSHMVRWKRSNQESFIILPNTSNGPPIKKAEILLLPFLATTRSLNIWKTWQKSER